MNEFIARMASGAEPVPAHSASGGNQETIPEALATIAESLRVDRVLVLENLPPGGPANVRLCYSWQLPSIPQVTARTFTEYPSNSPGLGEWLMPLSLGQPVMGLSRDARGVVADLFESLKTKSVLMVPVVVAGVSWGCVGVDSCHAEREWTPTEVSLLRVLATLIGTAIVNDRNLALLRYSEERFRTVAEAAQDGIVVIDAQGLVQYWNPSAERILGYSAREALGKDVHDWLAPPEYQGLAREKVLEFATNGQGNLMGRTRELRAVRKDGHELTVELALSPMRVDGEWYAVGLIRDVSARKDAEQRLAWLARNDALTGLLNRSVFIEELQQAMHRQQHGDKALAVFYLDLDHFKDVNDTFGHPSGDLLLKAVSERLKDAVRDTDRIARLGGDEFAILTCELEQPTDAGIVAEKLLRAMARPFKIEGEEVYSGATVGIATWFRESVTAEELLAHADLALYHAKSEGRGTYRFFADTMDHEVRQRISLLAELREALQHDELFLVYQPQVDMETRAVVGLEALVRWRHPMRGLVSPAQFIPAAENSGLIISVGDWVLAEVCRQVRRWSESGLRVPVVAINVSPTQFKAPSDLSLEIGSALGAHGMPGDMLEIELTETALMRASRQNNEALRKLRDQGVRIAIDDFGTGYSCLDYLRRFPASRIKIAQTFVGEITHNVNSAAITRATISLGRELGLSVIAEGVETREQVELLTRWGCHEAQGFHFARPMASDRIPDLLRAGTVPLSLDAHAK